jgi:hypothetical protein
LVLISLVSGRWRNLMPNANTAVRFPEWHTRLLKAAAIYNLVWGAIAIVFPMLLFRLVGMDPLPNYPELWQCIGMIVGVYGIGYWIAAGDPVRHWPIVLVGLLGKIFGPIGFLQAVLNDRFPVAMGFTILTNDLIWWVPFTLILLNARRQELGSGLPSVVEEPVTLATAGTSRKDPAARQKIVYSATHYVNSDT